MARRRRGGRATPKNSGRAAQTSSTVDATAEVSIKSGTFRVHGQLYEMLSMPLDVVMEICAYLHPEDVLNLSRLSKDFREFFTSRTSQPIWRSARLNVTPTPPPCPEDLTEISYAHLLFDTFCHCCLEKNCQAIYWSCRVRLCNECFDGPEGHISYIQYSSNDYHLYDDTTKTLLEDHGRVNALVPKFNFGCRKYGKQYRPLLEKFIRTWKDTPQENREEFEEECKRKTAAIWETTPGLAMWCDKFRESKRQEINKIRSERKKAIMAALSNGGWGPEVQVIASDSYEHSLLLDKFPTILEAQPLTPLAWSAIERPIVDYMSGVRERRLSKLHKKALISRVCQAMKEIYGILLEMPECKVSVCEVVCCSRRLHEILVPHNDNFNAKELRTDFRASVRDYVENWEEENKRGLAQEIREAAGLKKSADPFSLAIGSYLTCQFCDMVFTFRDAATHTCRTGEEAILPGDEWFLNIYHDTVLDWCYTHRIYQLVWCPNIFCYKLEKALKVIKACGLDYNSATVEDLDEKDCRLMCTNHLSKSKYIPIMDWRTAAYGESCYHSEKCVPTYELAPEEYREAIKESEAEHRRNLDNQSLELPSYHCAHCNMFRKPTSKNVMLRFLRYEEQNRSSTRQRLGQ